MHVTVYLKKSEHLIYFFLNFLSSALLVDWAISEKRSSACAFQEG